MTFLFVGNSKKWDVKIKFKISETKHSEKNVHERFYSLLLSASRWNWQLNWNIVVRVNAQTSVERWRVRKKFIIEMFCRFMFVSFYRRSIWLMKLSLNFASDGNVRPNELLRKYAVNDRTNHFTLRKFHFFFFFFSLLGARALFL